MTYEKLARGFSIFGALWWTGIWVFVVWVLFDISFTTGETNTPLYNAAWFGSFGTMLQAMDAWSKAVKRDA